jgi:hypothetical protein
VGQTPTKEASVFAQLRAHLSYANVMATVAVFIALGGSSYAALRVTSRNVPKDALTGADIKNLTGRDVRNNSLTGADVTGLGSGDVTNGGLLAEDFAAGQLPAGAQGPKGDPGPKGDTGSPGISGLEEVNDFSDFNSTDAKGVTANCPAGKKVVGGGAFVNASGGPVALRTSVPVSGSLDGWAVTAYEPVAHGGNWNVNARALCANVAP